MSAPRLILASRSPRRAQLLRDAGYRFEAVASPFEDPADPQTHSLDDARELAVDLAERKARALFEVGGHGDAVLLAADTICVGDDGKLLGTPTSEAEARSMLTRFPGRTHDVVTGVAIYAGNGDQRSSFAEAAAVSWGSIETATIEMYVSCGEWRGKAGGYNLFDRQQAGWPIAVHDSDDPTTVVGLPMKRLRSALATFGVLAQLSVTAVQPAGSGDE